MSLSTGNVQSGVAMTMRTWVLPIDDVIEFMGKISDFS